jgi:hypothetical protein
MYRKAFSHLPLIILCLVFSTSSASAITLKTTQNTYKIDEDIFVKYAGLPGNARDWIGIYKAGTSNGQYLDWVYAQGKKSGRKKFIGLAKGQYEARVFFNDTYKLQASFPFSVSNKGGNTNGGGANDDNNTGDGNDSYIPQDSANLKPDAWGIYTWGNHKNITPQTAPHTVGISKNLSWKDVEPSPNNYQFEKTLGEDLRKAAENNYYIILMLWVASPGGVTPNWLYNTGVPQVKTKRETGNPLGDKEGVLTYPYYLSEEYKSRYHSAIKAFGQYVDKLPERLHQRILFVQIAEGSTGDGQPYKGKPIKGYEAYQISSSQWANFRLNAWKQYKKFFMDNAKREIPLLVNGDANTPALEAWLTENFEVLGTKEGMFSHGWHISDGAERLAHSLNVIKQAELQGKRVFIRGEMDSELQVYGWATDKHPNDELNTRKPRALYTSALYALQNGVDLWNIPTDELSVHANQPAFAFFNKYAGKKDPRLATSAFCALRQGLDASDAQQFPVSQYGEAKKSNKNRYLKIRDAFAKKGAIQGDPEKALKGGMINRKRKDYNDVGWGIIRGNYQRFLTQIKPDQTSQGWWHQGPIDSIYSQFSRSFKLSGGKGEMLFKLDPYFFAQPYRPQQVEVRVV